MTLSLSHGQGPQSPGVGVRVSGVTGLVKAPASVLPASHLAQLFFPGEQQGRQKNSSPGRSASIEMKPFLPVLGQPARPLPHAQQLQDHHCISVIVRDPTGQTGRRMVLQGDLGHRDGKGTGENIMARAPLKGTDS